MQLRKVYQCPGTVSRDIGNWACREACAIPKLQHARCGRGQLRWRQVPSHCLPRTQQMLSFACGFVINPVTTSSPQDSCPKCAHQVPPTESSSLCRTMLSASSRSFPGSWIRSTRFYESVSMPWTSTWEELVSHFHRRLARTLEGTVL